MTSIETIFPKWVFIEWSSQYVFDKVRPISTRHDSLISINADPNQVNSKIKLRAETRGIRGPQVEIQGLPVPIPGSPSSQQPFLTPSIGHLVVF